MNDLETFSTLIDETREALGRLNEVHVRQLTELRRSIVNLLDAVILAREWLALGREVDSDLGACALNAENVLLKAMEGHHKSPDVGSEVVEGVGTQADILEALRRYREFRRQHGYPKPKEESHG